MTIQELQNWVEDNWKNSSKHRPSTEQQILYIIEELGEVAEAIRKNAGLKERKNTKVDLGSEIADLIISIVTLSNTFEVDIEKEIEGFKTRLAARQK